MKKGFTLVELLAVIVILAIILAIAIPSITNVIDNSKKSTLANNAKVVLKSLKLDYDAKHTSGTFTDTFILYDSGVKTTYPSANNMAFSFSDVIDGGIVIYSDGTTMMAVHDGTYCATKLKTSNDITVTETTKANCIDSIYYKQATAPFSSLITNGDFTTSGTTGWSTSGGNNNNLSNQLYHTSNGGYAYSQPWYNFSFAASQKYYVSFDYSNDSQVTSLSLRWMRNNGSGGAEDLATLSTSNSNKRYSGVHLITSAGSYTSIGLNILQYAPANYGFYVDNVLLINLTSSYGAGNEPITTEMDKNINKVWIDTSATNTPKRLSGGGWRNF